MPALSTVTADFITNPGMAVSPIVGNSEHGSACYDPATGKALYAVYDPDNGFKCYRTIGTYKTLAEIDNSVEYLSTIVGSEFHKARNIGLTLIGGTVYALITGTNITSQMGGMWVYRDTGGGGAGPWVKHGTVRELAVADTTDGTRTSTEAIDVRNGGEIFVSPSGLWIVSHHYLKIENFGGILRFKDFFGISTSGDGGETWIPEFLLRQGFGEFGPVFDGATPQYNVPQIFGGSSSFGLASDGSIWAGWVSEGSRQLQFHSDDDGDTWNLYEFSTTGSAVYKFPFSVGDRYYAERNQALSYTTVDPILESYTSLGIDLNDYGFNVTEDAPPHFCNIHTDRSPYLIATQLGKVIGIGRAGAAGWRLWVSES